MEKKSLILLFEDEPQFRADLTRWLISLDYDVAPYGSPYKAYQDVKTGKYAPDFLILDIKMEVGISKFDESYPSDKAGIELAKKLLKIRSVPVIFISNYRKDYLVKAEDVMHHAFIDKNCSIEELNARIQEVSQNFFKESLPDSPIRLSPSGRICIKYMIAGKTTFHLIDINDILYFKGSKDTVKVVVKGGEFSVGIAPGNFWKLLSYTMSTQCVNNPFIKIYESNFANVSNITHYDNSKVYFDSSEETANLSGTGFNNLQNYLQPLPTDTKTIQTLISSNNFNSHSEQNTLSKDYLHQIRAWFKSLINKM